MAKEISDTFSWSPPMPFSLRGFEDFQKRFSTIGVTLDSSQSYFSVEGFPPMPVDDFEIKGESQRKIYMHQLHGTSLKGGNLSITLHRLKGNTIQLDSKYQYSSPCTKAKAENVLQNVQSVVKAIYSQKANGSETAWPHS